LIQLFLWILIYMNSFTFEYKKKHENHSFLLWKPPPPEQIYSCNTKCNYWNTHRMKSNQVSLVRLFNFSVKMRLSIFTKENKENRRARERKCCHKKKNQKYLFIDRLDPTSWKTCLPPEIWSCNTFTIRKCFEASGVFTSL